MADNRCNTFRTTIGGQALIEGILMRGPERQAIVVRDPEGGLVVKEEELKLIKDKYPILGLPLVRGSVTFLDSMVKGVKALMFSADYYPEEAGVEEPSKFEKWLDEKLGNEKMEKVLIAFAVVAAVFFSDILLTTIERVLLPAVYLYIGTAAAGAVLEGELMERVGSLLKKLIGWALGGLLTLFTAFLTISGAVAGTADAQAVKVAKAAVSAAVPVVGGILSEAAESMLAGAGLLRGLLGAFGALAVLSFCLVPFLRLGGQYLLYQCASLAAAAAGPKKLTGLLTALGDAFGLVLAMTAASALLLLISLVSSLTAVVP